MNTGSDYYAAGIRRGMIFAAIAATALAITNVLTPSVYVTGTNPLSLLVLRAFFVAFVVGLVLALSGRMKILTLRQEVICLLSGLLFMFAGIGLLGSFAITPVSRAVLVLYLFPIFTILLDSSVRRSMPSLRTFALLLMALAGLVLVLQIDQGFEITTGVALALLAAVSVAATFVWNNHMLAQIDPEQITFRMFFVNFVIFTLWIYLYGGFELPTSSYGLGQLAALLCAFVVAFSLMFRASQMAGSVRTAMIMNLEPVITILLSMLLLAESMTGSQMLGAAMVLAAVFLSQGKQILGKN